ncbi:hypothetical protein L6452_15344 [Arctium lappa]|uniref:Uncharacterized protein n=1 Tax=Arctium lappa TaxID=4217 RepID=A0ACB9CNC0_ARCLA|nr:hypothetical protein L6452_15344 [Arctium lappa]
MGEEGRATHHQYHQGRGWWVRWSRQYKNGQCRAGAWLWVGVDKVGWWSGQAARVGHDKMGLRGSGGTGQGWAEVVRCTWGGGRGSGNEVGGAVIVEQDGVWAGVGGVCGVGEAGVGVGQRKVRSGAWWVDDDDDNSDIVAGRVG